MSREASAKSGDYDGGYSGGSDAPTRVAMDTYDRILPYTIEVGSSAHIENYLTGLLGKQQLSDWVRSQGVQKPKLLELLMSGAVRTQAESVDELCALLDIRYLWFVPSNKRVVLLDSHKHDLGLRSELKEKIRKYSDNAANIDKLVDKLLITSRSYYKFKSNYAKKSLAVIRKAGAKAYELDHIGVVAPIKYLIGCVKCETTTAAPKSIDDKLREIDLMTMYPKDPLAVRLFIERLHRDINTLRELPSARNVPSLLKDLEHERELARWESQAKREAEARRSAERERENLQRALAESKLTAREEEIARREKAIEPSPQTSQLTGEEFSKSSPFYIPKFGEKKLPLEERLTKMTEKKRSLSAP